MYVGRAYQKPPASCTRTLQWEPGKNPGRNGYVGIRLFLGTRFGPRDPDRLHKARYWRVGDQRALPGGPHPLLDVGNQAAIVAPWSRRGRGRGRGRQWKAVWREATQPNTTQKRTLPRHDRTTPDELTTARRETHCPSRTCRLHAKTEKRPLYFHWYSTSLPTKAVRT